MQIFYLENPEKKILLSTEESKHTTKVLRKKEGDILNFTDGKGFLYRGKITISDNKNTEVEIIKKEKRKKIHNYYLHIAIAPTKNINRFETFLEKATEIGIDEITPIICEHSERKIIKEERCNRILISAMKQSLKYHLPKLNETTSINKFLMEEFNGNKCICHCKDEKKYLLKNIKKTAKNQILIGPEGGFSSEEIQCAIINKYKPVSIGNSRFRTETAGIIATNIISIKH